METRPLGSPDYHTPVMDRGLLDIWRFPENLPWLEQDSPHCRASDKYNLGSVDFKCTKYVSPFPYNLISHRLPYLCLCLTQRVPAFLLGPLKTLSFGSRSRSLFLREIWTVYFRWTCQNSSSLKTLRSEVVKCQETSFPCGSTVCICVSHLALQVKKHLSKCCKFVLSKRGLA